MYPTPGTTAVAAERQRSSPGRSRSMSLVAAWRTRRARTRADRALHRLAHRTPAPIAATEEEMRSPDWCWTHGCHRSACPGPH